MEVYTDGEIGILDYLMTKAEYHLYSFFRHHTDWIRAHNSMIYVWLPIEENNLETYILQ